MKVKLVAYKKENGSCLSVFKCKNVDDIEYNKMLNEEEENKQREFEERSKLYNDIELLKNEIENLKNEIKFLKGEEENEESN